MDAPKSDINSSFKVHKPSHEFDMSVCERIPLFRAPIFDGGNINVIWCLWFHRELSARFKNFKRADEAFQINSEKGTQTRPSSASRRKRFLRKSVNVIASLRIIIRSCPFTTKNNGDFPRVMASRAGRLMSLSAKKTPRVNGDLPSILPRKTSRSASGNGCFSHFDSNR